MPSRINTLTSIALFSQLVQITEIPLHKWIYVCQETSQMSFSAAMRVLKQLFLCWVEKFQIKESDFDLVTNLLNEAIH